VNIHRREFLGCGAGLSFVSLAGGFATPGLFARAAGAAALAGANDRALVVVELSGGNDGLNTVIPFEDPLYYKNRRTLAVPKKEVVRLSDRAGLHPRMKALGALYKDGRVAVVQGVGYPEPNRSHFRSMEIWHTASVDATPPSAGWLGRALDLDPAAGSPESFPRGLSLTEGLPEALHAVTASVPVVAQLDGGASEVPSHTAAVKRKLSTAVGSGRRPGGPAGGRDNPVSFLRGQAETLYRTADRLKDATARVKPADEKAGYPEGDLAGQLRRAAQILAAGLGVRVLFCAQDGYDTHAGQAETHADLLGTLSDSLAAFQRDLAARSLGDRVAVLVFSEFGRRVDENASKGTDHGAASCVFVVGPKVKASLAGRYPALDQLGDGDLIHSTDFRSVYATVLGRWLGTPPEAVLGREFPVLDLF
jgi:uncharacterized protein (DUF1501 family)